MYFDPEGNLVTCADEKGEIWSIDKTGKHKVLLSNFNGHTFNGPNDLWIDAKGNIFFTDPYYQRDYWERKHPDSALGGQRLYYLAKNQASAQLADSDLVQPNGITGSPDGKYLYVADMGRWKTFKYRVSTNGKLSNREIFCDEASDGMTVDKKGNLYLTGQGVKIYNPKGEKIAQIDIPEKWTANVCFGGRNKNILFITASEGIYILPMKVRGVE
jgi:gluconolactonase